MSRVQLALNVSDVEAAVAFYSSLFGVAPAKRRPGYANFSIDEPPLKLVLIESAAGGGTLNHLGVEVPTSDEVEAAWKLIDPVLEYYAAHPPGKMPQYPAGSWGPSRADVFIARDGHAGREP